jgi:hypothetical protein
MVQIADDDRIYGTAQAPSAEQQLHS